MSTGTGSDLSSYLSSVSHSGASASTRQSSLRPPPRSSRKRSPTSASLPPQPRAPLASRSLKRTNQTVNTQQLRNDRLGTLVSGLVAEFQRAESWDAFVNEFRGRSYLSPELEQVDHPAAELLREWRDDGVPAMSTSDPWTLQEKDDCFQRGCHKSATDHAGFLREEMAEFIENRFWAVLPYRLVRHLANLSLSPAAVKDERDRRPRLLCDHSWTIVNESTVPHAPPEAMQFGGALHRTLRLVRHAHPRYGPVHLAKHDIKDGFYRMFLRAADCLRLAIVLPTYQDEEPCVAIPMSCTMGWVQSPPSFCVMSETVADLANSKFKSNPRKAAPHRLDERAAALDRIQKSAVAEDREPKDAVAAKRLSSLSPGPPRSSPEEHLERPPPSNRPFQRPIGATDVFVDDFIQIGQGSTQRLNTLRRHLFHAIDEVLSRPGLSEAHRNEAISLKKLLQGDGSWCTRKLILGWIIDTVRQTLELPPHRKIALAEIFEDLSTRSRVSSKQWQRVLGKLRFVSRAIPGSGGLFSTMQLALNRAKGHRVRITRHLREHISDFARLSADLCARPTYLAEIVPQEPTLLGATDAAKAGMGGVFFDADGQPFVWRQPFSQEVQDNLVSSDNPKGAITNSDLEQAGLIGQADVMCHSHDTRYATLSNRSDNTPAVGRFKKGAVSCDTAAAYLCRLASHHQRAWRYCNLVGFISGLANAMADSASCLQQLTDAAFLAYFEQHYPQAKPWRLLHLDPEMNSRLTCALRCSSHPKPMCPKPPRPAERSSPLGLTSASLSAGTLPSVMSLMPKTKLPTFSSSDSAIGAKDVEPAKSLSALGRWRTHYWRWARGSPTWVSPILEKPHLEAHKTIPYWRLFSSASATRMSPPSVPTPPMSPSFELSTTPSTQTTPTKVKSTRTSLTSPSPPSSGSSGPPSISSSRTTQSRGPRPSAFVTSASL